MHPAIAIRNLQVSRHKKVILQDINFTVTAGKIVGLFGPSGAGKTTLMRSIVGLQNINSGYLHVLGHRSGILKLRQLIGYMSQEQGFYTDLTVLENLNYFAAIVGAPSGQPVKLVSELKLEGHAHHLCGNLSGGQQTRVSLGIALLGSPKLLVLDEPTSGLDPVLRRDLWQYFKKLAAVGVTILISSHDLSEANHCDDVLLIRDGQILSFSSPAHLLSSTGSKNTEEAFLRLVEGHK